jgi:hypothetical protein
MGLSKLHAPDMKGLGISCFPKTLKLGRLTLPYSLKELENTYLSVKFMLMILFLDLLSWSSNQTIERWNLYKPIKIFEGHAQSLA